MRKRDATSARESGGQGSSHLVRRQPKGRAMAQKRKKDRNYSAELFHLRWAKENVALIRESLRKTGAVQTKEAARRLAKSLDGAIRNAEIRA